MITNEFNKCLYYLSKLSFNISRVQTKSCKFNQYKNKISYIRFMSFQNTVGPDGSININVIPSFGRIINVVEVQKDSKLRQIEAWRARFGSLKQRPVDFDPSRYVSFSTREVVEEPVDQQNIHQYVERSRLSRRLGF